VKVLVCDWREKTHILCIFREDDVAEAEFAEFKTEWDRLVGLHRGRTIGGCGQKERVWLDNLCIESKIDTWVKRWPKWFWLSPKHVFRLEEVHAR
jgi:hypothetical protein